MGLDIVAISKAKAVICRDDEECEDLHYTVEQCPKPRDRLKARCYVIGKGGSSIGFRAGSYLGYSQWLLELSMLGLGVPPDEVWQHPRRYHGKSFVELIAFANSTGDTIGQRTSAILYEDFAAFASRARKRFFRPPEPPRGPPLGKRPSRHIGDAPVAAAEELARALGGKVVGGDTDDKRWMWEVYLNFRRAFKLARNGGFVLFC